MNGESHVALDTAEFQINGCHEVDNFSTFSVRTSTVARAATSTDASQMATGGHLLLVLMCTDTPWIRARRLSSLSITITVGTVLPFAVWYGRGEKNKRCKRALYLIVGYDLRRQRFKKEVHFMDRNECLRKVEEMAKDEFREKIIRKAMKTDVFNSAMALGTHNLSKEEMRQLCDILADADIPVTYPHDEMELIVFKEIFGSILSRATQIR